jgi:hypothetical protein
VQQLPSESIPQSSTPLDDTVTGTSPAAGGDDAPANAPQPISAASVKPESDLSSVPAAEVLQAERDSVTLAPLAADAPYIYDSLDDQTFHSTLSDFVQQAQGQYAEFGLTLYYRILPGLDDAQRRFLEHKGNPDYRLDGCAGIEQYVKKLGLTPARVRKWRQRDKERQFTREIKLLAGGSTTCPECGRGKGHAPSCQRYDSEGHLTETQRAVVQALVGQGFKKKDAVAMVKAAHGEDFEQLFRSALSPRPGEDGTATPAVEGERQQELDDEQENSGDHSTGESWQESAGTTTVPAVGPTPAAVTYVDWESHRLPVPDFKLKYFKAASGNFTDRFSHAVRGRAFTKILDMLKGKPQQVLSNAHDFAQLAVVLRGASDNLNLLAAAIATALTLPVAPEPEPPQEQEASQKTPMDTLETTMAVGNKSSSEIKQLIANPKSHSYDLVALNVALSARLAFEAAQ